MPFLLRRNRGRIQLRRRLIGAALLFAYVATAAGVPLPSGAPARKSRELFPCSASGCGCDSADRCWKSCCCHTLAERFAWARKHGVRPPAFAIAQAQLAGLDIGWLKSKVCIRSISEPDGCYVAAKTDAPSCCQKQIAEARGKTGRACCTGGDHATPPSAAAGHVVGWQALKCRGQSANWMLAVPPLPAVHVELRQEFPHIQWLGPPSSEHVLTTSRAPAVPPPETA